MKEIVMQGMLESGDFPQIRVMLESGGFPQIRIMLESGGFLQIKKFTVLTLTILLMIFSVT